MAGRAGPDHDADRNITEAIDAFLGPDRRPLPEVVTRPFACRSEVPTSKCLDPYHCIRGKPGHYLEGGKRLPKLSLSHILDREFVLTITCSAHLDSYEPRSTQSAIGEK